MQGQGFNYYDVLGIAPQAEDQEIKAAWRKKAHEHHPDKNPGQEEVANKKFLLAQMAYEVLGDPVKREAYDNQMRTRRGQHPMGAGPIARTTEDLAKDAALVRAIGKGNLRLAETLLTQGAFARAQDEKGQPVLHSAIRQDRIDLCLLLLVWGADPNAKDNTGRTSLHVAAELKDYLGMVDLMVANGGLCTVVNQNGETPLHQAAFIGNEEALEIMLEAGADLLGRDELGQTPLHHAMKGKNPAKVSRLLMQWGAKLNVRDKQGISPLRIAMNRELDDLARHLRSMGGQD